jgi:hypothetical protein
MSPLFANACAANRSRQSRVMLVTLNLVPQRVLDLW